MDRNKVPGSKRLTQHTTPSGCRALWQIYHRVQPPPQWEDGGNLPWDAPEFSERMLREHLDQAHGAASRQRPEILRQVAWLWQRLGLEPGSRVLDITCGPGLYAVELAAQGVSVTGIDFSPASIRYARELAHERGVAGHCHFLEGDVRELLPSMNEVDFDAALFIYGQLAVFPRDVAARLVVQTASLLRTGGRLALELLDFDRVDREPSNWWFTDDKGLWGEKPFLHLGERSWDDNLRTAVERFFIVDLETGQLQTHVLCDTAYETSELLALLRSAGFSQAQAFPGWDGVDLYDAEEWVAYVAER